MAGFIKHVLHELASNLEKNMEELIEERLYGKNQDCLLGLQSTMKHGGNLVPTCPYNLFMTSSNFWRCPEKI